MNNDDLNNYLTAFVSTSMNEDVCATGSAGAVQGTPDMHINPRKHIIKRLVTVGKKSKFESLFHGSSNKFDKPNTAIHWLSDRELAGEYSGVDGVVSEFSADYSTPVKFRNSAHEKTIREFLSEIIYQAHITEVSDEIRETYKELIDIYDSSKHPIHFYFDTHPALLVKFMKLLGFDAIESAEGGTGLHPKIHKTVGIFESATDDGFQVVGYHGTNAKFDKFRFGNTKSYMLFSEIDVERNAIFFADNAEYASKFGKHVTKHTINVTKDPRMDDEIAAKILRPLVEKTDTGWWWSDGYRSGKAYGIPDDEDPADYPNGWLNNLYDGISFVWEVFDNPAVVENFKTHGYNMAYVEEDDGEITMAVFDVNSIDSKNTLIESENVAILSENKTEDSMSTVNLNTTCVWSGYELTFKYEGRKFIANTRGGNRGTMTLNLHSIDDVVEKFTVSYLHDPENYWTINYESIREVE